VSSGWAQGASRRVRRRLAGRPLGAGRAAPGGSLCTHAGALGHTPWPPGRVREQGVLGAASCRTGWPPCWLAGARRGGNEGARGPRPGEVEGELGAVRVGEEEGFCAYLVTAGMSAPARFGSGERREVMRQRGGFI
jgi:hypothetical protein